MKIAFLTPEYPHPKTGTSGGLGTSIKNLAAGLVRQGATVSVLVYGQKEDAVFIEENITFYRIKNIKVKGLSLFLTQYKIQKLINTLVSEQKVDVVEAPEWTGITSFIHPNCPMIVKLHGSDTYFCHLDKRPVKWFNRFLEKRALQKADALLSVSQYTAELTKELFALDRNFTIIPNAVDIAKFDVTQSETVTDENMILYFGTLIRKKGLLELPLIFNEVVKMNADAKLILIGKDSPDILSGNNSTWKMMKPLFSAEALKNVTYSGSVPYEEIKNTIKQASVCVFPTFAEALPVSWIEAMAMKKPIVASNIGWAPEVIDNGSDGFLVHPAKHSEYARKIVELLADKNLQQIFGSAARRKTEEKFNIETVAARSLAFYTNLI